MKLRYLLVALILWGNGLALMAQQGRPQPRWYPFPKLPAVLWFDDYEEESHLGSGGQVAETPDKPGSKSYQLGKRPVMYNNQRMDASVATLPFGTTRLSVPGGLKPTQLIFRFNVWAEEVGSIRLKVATKRSSKDVRGTKVPAKKWTPISFRLSEVKDMKPEDVLQNVEVFYLPGVGTQFRKVYLDDVMILNGVKKPEALLPILEQYRAQMKQQERDQEKDGFTFRLRALHPLKEAVKGSRRKRRSVLVFPPRAEDGATLQQAFKTGASKTKLYGHTFQLAESPDGQAGGLEDARTLLPYNLDKHQSEFVIIMFSYKDMKTPGCAPEVVQVAIERALQVGCIPVIVMPPLLNSAPGRANVEDFVKKAGTLARTKGVVVIEASSLLAKISDALVKEELGPKGLEATAAVVCEALKCLNLHVLGRR